MDQAKVVNTALRLIAMANTVKETHAVVCNALLYAAVGVLHEGYLPDRPTMLADLEELLEDAAASKANVKSN